MKRILFFLGTLPLLISCQPEYEFQWGAVPLVMPTTVLDNDGMTVTLQGQVMGQPEILECGFFIVSYYDSKEILCNDPDQEGYFFSEQLTALPPGGYEARAFIKTVNGITAWGDPVIFSTTGRMPPVIRGLSRYSAYDQDTVVLYGQHLALFEGQTRMVMSSEGSTSNDPLPIVSVNSDSIVFLAGPNHHFGDVRITAYIDNGFPPLALNFDFNVLAPQITSVTPSTVRNGDIMILRGTAFDQIPEDFGINISYPNVLRILEKSDQEIKVQLFGFEGQHTLYSYYQYYHPYYYTKIVPSPVTITVIGD